MVTQSQQFCHFIRRGVANETVIFSFKLRRYKNFLKFKRFDLDFEGEIRADVTSDFTTFQLALLANRRG